MPPLIKLDRIEEYLDNSFPSWATRRNGWHYAGTITPSSNFDALVKEFLKPEPGQLREVDYYPQGAVCWYAKEL